ncbi:(E,E)-geranyllinalool synthase [Senna tora]|uniref:(E,E)-geranyllinalool synthase n=1 Tax=Senna tora TaxID=362788 RepID=A0A834W2K5_9FABA|nr:(E,E)-geranyllinalool synthase [Senna tora]
MFNTCFIWLLNNQKEDGFWGECDALGNPTIQSLSSTLASIVALKKWNASPTIIERGLSFIHANAEKLLEDVKEDCPRWFAIILPAMVELAESNGLEVVFPEAVRETVSYIFKCRQNILNKEKLVGEHNGTPLLLSYLEALPPSYGVSEEDILNNLSDDGSLFNSPSATAKAFMATGNKGCLSYLQSLAQRCPNGVPQTYPMDEDLIKLCMVNQVEKLGLAEYFAEEIEETLEQIYRNYINQKSWVKPSNMIATQLHKDSLAFQLLRMHGYKVSPLMLCWFLHHEEIGRHVEKSDESFTSAMINVYRASNLMLCGEYELEEAKSFSTELLHKFLCVPNKQQHPHTKVKPSPFHKMIEYELNLPWFARMEHLEHRMWIEENEANSLWAGKASYHRISYSHNDELLQLAIANYEFRQSIYKNELEELKRWDGKELRSHSKVIFDALDNLVTETASTYLLQEGADITHSLRDLWYETFVSWLIEAKWSRNGENPSIDDYLKTGMVSIATHTLVLPASCFLKLHHRQIRPLQYQTITKLLMLICRLLNDLQSYEKEKEEGKMNSVLINLIENSEMEVEDSKGIVRDIIDRKKKELLEHVLMDEMCDWPKPVKQFHLLCLKVFQMFFNSANRYDSNTDMLEDINKAIYLPLTTSLKKKPLNKVVALHSGMKNKKFGRINFNFNFNNSCFKHNHLIVGYRSRRHHFRGSLIVIGEGWRGGLVIGTSRTGETHRGVEAVDINEVILFEHLIHCFTATFVTPRVIAVEVTALSDCSVILI